MPYNITAGGQSYQPAHTGQAYVLVDYLFYEQPILQVPLLDSLKPDKKYYCEFFVNQVNAMKISCNNHGMLFTKTAVYPDTVNYTCGVLQANPQILPYGNPIISDTVNWVKVSGIYKAQGGEKYVSIGNFFTWQNTKYITTNATGTGNGASYLIDDVSVIPLDSFNLKADAGRDTTIHIGDSAFIGSLTNGIDSLKWLNQNTGNNIDSTRPGFWVHPQQNTCYVLTQTVNGFTSSDTVCVNVLPLPLKLLSFTAQMQPTPSPFKEGNVLLNWQTANEVNVSHINIQRAINNNDFATIGNVNASCCAYSYLDNKLPITTDKLTLNYRLEIVDKDGSKTYSEVKQVVMSNEQVAINIYPNPATNTVRILGKQIQQIKIVDILGNILINKTVNNDSFVDVDIAKLQSGIYIVQSVQKDGTILTNKLIKQ